MKHNDSLQSELNYRAGNGLIPVTLKTLKARLAALGYKLDRRLDCRSMNRYMTGERSGQSYPAINLYVRQSDDGLSFAHVDARRDDNFRALQALRLSGELFALGRGCILEL